MKKLFAVVAAMTMVASAHANTVTGTIHTLHINTQSNMGHIYLDGQPLFDGTGCTGPWTGNSLDEDKFMIYLWPALTNAKNKGYPVSIVVEGCLNGYPRIVSIDVVPR
jgi:hypothetical protein